MRLTAVPRITFGLMSLAVLLLLVFDWLFNLFPAEADVRRAEREQKARMLAVQVVVLVQENRPQLVARTLEALRRHDPQIHSVALRRQDGVILAQAGEHPSQWPVARNSWWDAGDVTLELRDGGRRWGALEIHYRGADARVIWDWLVSGPAKMVALFVLLSVPLFYLYLRRMLQHLDPSSAVPDRVRNAFDTLTEGVLVLDTECRVLLANRAFEALRPPSADLPEVGMPVQKLDWLRPAGDDADREPWLRTLRDRKPLRGLPFVVREGDEVLASVVINLSPVTDEADQMRGCIVTLGDVTALERSHRQLMEALADLATSKRELETKNDELEQLANHDVLSGCLNRRAFFEHGERLFAAAQRHRTPLVCVMADIDHFKSINDRYGHAVGDQAIRRFAALLRQHVRAGDLLGRYGGEEFVLVLPGTQRERALQLAEAARAAVAANRGEGLDPGEALAMSASFGVAMIHDGASTLEALIDHADRAMYLAKQGGRNRVVFFEPEVIAA